ncbi:DUF4278 domain-containing protein [Synechococcus sp. CBW1004]|jgi:hypothetical protein|uniref:DUF4278 domain-containing protein n=1 Tax=Synechococcus sp. CBW1004 TaxID=1353136 RepID=UPI0018CDFB7A|nr:DUF4278 domain-containing protein [Synechococcus sp. CBW1004]QPN63306.1 DUF4278 domain-containing protein [Synechococcus sp. CBW1004]
MTRLQYRGVSYDNSRHEQLPAAPVEHIYRGRHFNAPIRHEAAAVDPELELHYRGHVYHHQASEAQR